MLNVPQPAAPEQPAQFATYGDIEEWAKTASPFRPVYLYLQPEPRGGGRHAVDSWFVTAQQPDEAGTIHTCRIPVLPITRAMGKQIETLALGFVRHVARWLQAAHYDLIPGLYAVPVGLQLLEGACHFIAFDDDLCRFIRTDIPGGDV